MSVKINYLDKERSNLSFISCKIFEILEEAYEHAPWTLEMLVSDLMQENTAYYLARVAGVANDDTENYVGFLSVSTVMDEMEIVNIAVKPDFQSQGMASRLMAQIDDFEGEVFLEVRQSNLSAQKLYEKFGFQPYHKRKNYYQHPTEDAILMKRRK